MDREKFETIVDGIDSRYNYVPKEISKMYKSVSGREKKKCESCYYRMFRLQQRQAALEAKQKGGTMEDYMQGYVLRYEAFPECKREKCLIDNIKLESWRPKTSAS